MVSDIFYEYIHYLQKITDTRLFYIVWLLSCNTNGLLIAQSSLSINEPLVLNDGN